MEYSAEDETEMERIAMMEEERREAEREQAHEDAHQDSIEEALMSEWVESSLRGLGLSATANGVRSGAVTPAEGVDHIRSTIANGRRTADWEADARLELTQLERTAKVQSTITALCGYMMVTSSFEGELI